ncbi:MAG TPA: hypothetical protein VMF67_12800 [Rhizomicrobium sp.]|nr:hypothetical protein [Rhizomicrobium sp.]
MITRLSRLADTTIAHNEHVERRPPGDTLDSFLDGTSIGIEEYLQQAA